MMAHHTRPFIGINADFVPAAKSTPGQLRLHAGYFEAILAAGGLPVVMPLLGKETEINAFLDRVDGFVLTGGLDLDPKRQGLPSHPAVQPMCERREENDRLLVRRLLARQTPVLGVGVGMHQLNVALGGSLFLHLPEEQPRGLPHSDPSCHGPHRHTVLLQPNTRVDEIYGGGRLDYRGPQFGWFDIPDEYALAKFDALEAGRSGRPPLFMFFPTISTHTPFRPTPPLRW